MVWHHPKHGGQRLEFGLPLLRTVAMVGCGTRPRSTRPSDRTIGELGYAHRLLPRLNASMPLPADASDVPDAVTDTGAASLSRPTCKQRPTVRPPLPDGSRLTTVRAGKYQAERGCGRLPKTPRRLLKARVRERDNEYTFTVGKHSKTHSGRAPSTTSESGSVGNDGANAPAEPRRCTSRASFPRNER
ncbi:hypothetical protein QFZ58_000159 [Streptomyces sp. B1I3]|nr:hypothetical protein [Streptomyces sp. B1I3]